MPTENQQESCRHCGRAIVWHFDRDELDRIVKPYGFWRDAEHLTEACGGPDGDPVEDMWHEPGTDEGHSSGGTGHDHMTHAQIMAERDTPTAEG